MRERANERERSLDRGEERGVLRVLSYGFMDFIIVGPRLVTAVD